MSSSDILRVSLEAAIAAQFSVFALYLAVSGRGKRPAAFYLALLCAALTLIVAINAATAISELENVRLASYFIDLCLGPLLLGFMARTGDASPALRLQDWPHACVPLLGVIALASGSPSAPDALVLTSQTGYLIAACYAWRRREPSLRAAGLRAVALALLSAFAVVAILRVWVLLDAHGLTSYRDGVGYPLVLTVVLLLSSFMTLAALRDPAAFSRTARPVEAGTALETRLIRLIDEEKLYLQPNLALADVAARLHEPARAISALIGARFGENFSSFLNRRRAEAAARALRETTLPITAIMFDAGFGSKSAFQREFRRCFGTTPKQYREGDDQHPEHRRARSRSFYAPGREHKAAGAKKT